MLILIALAIAQVSPLPDLKIEASVGGSVIVIRNTHSTQPLTAYLIELVDYPGSSFALSQDELAQGGEPLAARNERRLPITNMTVGAAPDYVKMRAALYADGSAAGPDGKVAELRARRGLLQSTIREIIAANPGNLKVMQAATPASRASAGSRVDGLPRA